MQRMTFFTLMCVLAAFIIWIGGFLGFNQYIRSFEQNTTQKADAIVALTGGRNRIAEAVRLYNEGRARILIISGVAPHVTLSELEKQNHTSVQKRADGQVFLGAEATNTVENAIEVSEIIRRRDISSVLLVTSYYHMPRSEQEILAHNPDIQIIPHAVYTKNISHQWWRRPKSFYLIASEYNKFLFVYLKNYIHGLFERN